MAKDTGRLIRKYRKEQELTLKELGAKSGVNWNTIAKIERDGQTPQVETLQKLAKALNIDISKFI